METEKFKLHAPWPPSGDQPQAIESLLEGLERGEKCSTLMGVTGSGKTFTVANVVAKYDRPTLVLAHNKTLAAQLFSEFKRFFPENAVHYYVSYYDYYQPEAYIPSSDTFIEKDASINTQIERMRLATTKSLIERRDVIVVASVSCIYGMGKRKNYEDAIVNFSVGERWNRRSFQEALMKAYYERNDFDLQPGKYRVRGDVLEVYPVYSDATLRFSFFDEELEFIEEVDPVSGRSTARKQHVSVFPAQHYVTSDGAIAESMDKIKREMELQVGRFKYEGKYLEAERLGSRTRYDMEMLAEAGYCSGIENYSRYLDGRAEGEQPGTLIDFFPPDFLMIVDESHITLPQVRGMYAGDQSRKKTLVEYGFRLPSALDNRPLNFEEFESKLDQILCVSATPGEYEADHELLRAEQVIRPTGLLDPPIEVRPVEGQIDDLISEVNREVDRGFKVLATTLTKRMAEDLTDYMRDAGIRVKYLHSDIDTLERAQIIRDMRLNVFDVLVGINLLREGLDIPEIALVAILDADKEGFLRSETSLIQTIGRAARNSEGHVIMYADSITDSMRAAIEETERRRAIQQAYNEEHHITPTTIKKAVRDLITISQAAEPVTNKVTKDLESMDRQELEKLVKELTKKMNQAAAELNFEEAVVLRDRMVEVKKMLLDLENS